MVRRWLHSVSRRIRQAVEWAFFRSEESGFDRLLTIALVTGTIALYTVFFLPGVGEGDEEELDVLIWTGALVVLSVPMAFLSAIQVDRIGARAVVRFVTMLLLYILMFTAFYNVLSQNDPDCFNERLGQADAIYFAMSVLTTTDFGDVRAVEGTCRALVATQMLLNLALFSGALVLLLSKVSRPGRSTG
jgi:hypothetical protein